MGGEMLGQIIRPGETFAAHFAVIRPLSGMDTKMPSKVAFSAERASAEETDERPFAGVLTYVEFQVLLRTDALTAKGAGEATFAPVNLVTAASQADHGIRVLGTIVVHSVVIRVANFAGTTG